MLDAIVANASVDIPECMIENELEYMLQEFEYRFSQMYRGMKLDDYFKYTNSSREDFKKDRKAEAEKNVKTRLVLEQVIKTDKIEPNEEELVYGQNRRRIQERTFGASASSHKERYDG